ncbi:MAG: ABC transporter permease [Actinomycetes bacterium]
MLLARRDLTVARGRFLLMGTVVALIALLGVLLAGLAVGLVDAGTSGLERLPVTHLAFQPGAESTFSRSFIPSDAADRLRGDGVLRTAPMGVSLFNAQHDRGAGQPANVVDVALFGVERESFLAPKVTSGSQLSGSGPAPVVISTQLLDEGVKVGDRLVVGLDQVALEVVGVSDVGTYGHVPVAYTDLPTWEQVTPGATTQTGRGLVSAVALQLRPDAAPSAVGDRAGLEVVTKQTSFNGSPGYVAETATMTLIRAFLLVISALIVAAFFSVWTVQRRDQIGLLKAMGASDRYVVVDAMTQVLMLLVVATVVGSLLGIVLGSFVPDEAPFILQPAAVVLAAVALVVAGLIGSLVAVRRITAVDPLVALGSNR